MQMDRFKFVEPGPSVEERMEREELIGEKRMELDRSKMSAQHDETEAGDLMKRHFEHLQNGVNATMKIKVEVTNEDKLQGAIIEAIGLIEQGHPNQAYTVLKKAIE